MLDAKTTYIYTPSKEVIRLENVLKGHYTGDAFTEEPFEHYIFSLNEKNTDNKFYKITAESGHSIIIEDSDNIALRVDNPEGPKKEMRWLTVNLIKEFLDKNEPINFKINNKIEYKKVEKIHKNNTIGTALDGIIFALILNNDSDFINNQITIRYDKHIDSNTKAFWLTEHNYIPYINAIFGNTSIIEGKVLEDGKYLVHTFDIPAIDDFVKNLLRDRKLYELMCKNDIKLNNLNQNIIDWILEKTTEKFQEGFLRACMQLYINKTGNTRPMVINFENYDFFDKSIQDLFININFLRNENQIINDKEFIFDDRKQEYFKLKSIEEVNQKDIIPVQVNTMKQTMICNGFSVLFA